MPGSVAVAITQEGLAGGSNLFPEQIENPVPYFKMGYSALSVTGTYNTQGQHVLVPQQTNCYGVGDCLIGSQFLIASGGFRDSADEGAHPFDLETHEDTHVFIGTCTTGCTTGSTTVLITPTTGGGTQGDGRFLIDVNSSKDITSASTGGTLISGTMGGPHATAQFSGTSFPVSIFLSTGQVIPSQSTNQAPGTVTFSIATSGVPSGYATNTAAIGSSSGLACVVDQNSGGPNNYEMAPYTVVDATHLHMTLNKPHQTLATVAFGGLCGYGLEQTVDTANGIRQLFPVVGSSSTTALYYAGGDTAVVGAMNQTSGFFNINGSIASIARAGNVVTVTLSGNTPADINGLTVTIAGVADSSYNGSFAVASTGLASFTYSQSGANSSSNGGTASILTGGFALYPMAEVLSVFDPVAKSVDGQMTLAPNNVAWAASDPVEQPHYYQELVEADTEFVGQSVPRPTSIERAGIQYQQNNGPGLIGWSITNSAPSANYLGYGGTHNPPEAAYEAQGIWLRTMDLIAGEEAVFSVHCKTRGCSNWNSGYNLFELQNSTGADTVAYTPQTSSLAMTFGGSPYSFTPQALNAGAINVGTINGTRAAEFTQVPRAQLATLLECLHAAAYRPCRIAVFGDSMSVIDYTNFGTGPTSSANVLPALLRTQLQAKYGSHGTGVSPAIFVLTDAAVNTDSWASTGTVAVSNLIGPAQGSSGTLLQMASGATATFTGGGTAYDTLNVYCATNASSGSLQVSVDGTSVGTACASTTSNATAHLAQFSGLAATAHTAVLTSTGTSYLYAAEGQSGTTGVSVDNYSVGSAAAGTFGASPSAQLAFSDLVPGGTQGFLVEQLINEPTQGESTTQYTAYLNAIVAHEQALSPSNPASGILFIPPIDIRGLTNNYVPYTAAALGVAQANNVAMINAQERWGASYQAASGLWDITGSSQPGVHFNDGGARDLYEMVYDTVVDPAPLGATGGCTSNCNFAGLTTLNSGTAGQALAVTSANTTSTNFHLTNTSSGGLDISLFTNGSGNFPGLSGSYDWTNSLPQFLWTDSQLQLWSSTGGFCWSNHAPPNADTCFWKTAADTVALGNGTTGNAGGTLSLANLNAGTQITAPTATITSNSTASTNFNLTNSSTGGIDELLFTNGSANNPGLSGFYDITTNRLQVAWTDTVLQLAAPAGGVCWGTGTAPNVDTCLWKTAAGTVALGGATAGDASGTFKAGLYQGPATAPSGSCSTVGWAFSQDGHATFCNGSSWVSKL